MYIELATDDPAVIHKAIAEATPALASQETLLVTIQRGREANLYHLALSTRTDKDPEQQQAGPTSETGDAP